MIASHVQIKRKVLEKIPEGEVNTKDELEQNDKTNEFNESELKPKSSLSLSEVKKNKKGNQQEITPDNHEENSNDETVWQLLTNFFLWPFMMVQRLYNRVVDSIFKNDWKFEFLEKVNWGLAISIFTAVCCLGFVLDVVRQHLHPEKYNNNNTTLLD